MTIDEQRAAVIKEACTWIGTPFHPESRLKGVGIDCGTFLLEVFERVGMLPHTELEHRAHDWHVHSTDAIYLREILKYAHRVESPLPGDIALFQYGKQAAHGAIVIEWPTIVIHASLIEKRVTKANITSALSRVQGFYRPNAWRVDE
jgi:cell wall-associated NlpC family hydrolase